MSFIKKVLISALAFIVLCTVFPNYSKAFTSVPLLEVIPNPINAGSNSEYHIFGSYSEYNQVTTLKVYFHEGTNFISSVAPRGSITVNGVAALSAQFRIVIADGSLEATIYLGQFINNGDSVDILFKKEAGLVNPIIPATCYKVRVVLLNFFGVELGTILSNSYRITSSIVQNLYVRVDPPVIRTKAEYTINFITGVRGALRSNQDGIMIRFPEGTSITNLLSKDNILLDGTSISSVYRDGSDPYLVKIYSTFDIPSNSQVSILFTKEAGITNPFTEGARAISVSTDSEPDWVQSAPFQISSPVVQNLLVSPENNSIAAVSSWDVKFSTSVVGALQKGSSIYVEFPQGFVLPQAIDSSLITVNGSFALGLAINQNVLSIVSPVDIYNGGNVEITISNKANIKNPILLSDYNILVYTDSDFSKASYTVKMVPSTLGNVSVSAKYSGTGSTNSFSVTFMTGSAYTLGGGYDTVDIKFDDKFSVPGTIPVNSITINNREATNVTSNVYEVIATVPMDLPPLSSVTVNIAESAGIKNPLVIGSYPIYVFTSKETMPVASNPVNITQLPVVDFTVAPAIPDGDNGFYRKSPTVQLSTSNGKDSYYKIDDKEFTPYSIPFVIPEGTHTVLAYSVDAAGNKGDIASRTFNVDSTPPKIIFEGGMSDIYANSTNATIRGSVSEPCVLQIAGTAVDVKSDMTFSVNLQITDKMPVSIYMRDLAGNAISMIVTAHIDTTLPVIQLVSPSTLSFETTSGAIDIQFKLSKPCTVTINSNNLENANGVYSYTSALSDGDNTFMIVAKDFVGNIANQTIIIKKVNQTQIKLVIGEKTAYIGSNQSLLDAAPFIEKGVTLVPIRFIAEAFGATVDYNGALQIININYKGVTIQLQVGSTLAFVDNVPRKLDVAPKIVSSRTFVPIRFISETFGADVQWDAATKTVTIVNKLQ